MNNALILENITRRFIQGGEKLEIFKGLNLAIRPGEIVALVGPSGAGKSTLLHIAGLLERPNEGDVIINGEKTNTLNDKKRTDLRLKYLGFIYQYHHLLPEFTALDNAAMPLIIAGVNKATARTKAKTILEKLGLGARLKHPPAKLSGGEQQRVAIARALANSPKLLLADEPTGNLDPHNSQIVFAELLNMVRETGLAALIATHNPELAHKMDRVIKLSDGILQEQ